MWVEAEVENAGGWVEVEVESVCGWVGNKCPSHTRE